MITNSKTEQVAPKVAKSIDKNRKGIQDNIVQKLGPRPHGILDLSIRMGKTRITIERLKIDNPKRVLWVTPNVKLRDEDIPQEIEKWWNKTALAKFDIICWSSLKNIPKPCIYDTVVLDEIQYITVQNSRALLGCGSSVNIIGLTGTLPKHTEKWELYEALGLKVLESFQIEEAIDNSIIADYAITVHEIRPDNMDITIPAGTKAKPFQTTELKMLSWLSNMVLQSQMRRHPSVKYWTMRRLRAIYNSPTKTKLAKKLIEEELKGRTLIFAGSIEQAEALCPYRYHSKTSKDDLNDFISGKIDKLACVNAGGTGFTYKDVDHFLIVQANSNNRGDVTQKIGRSLLSQGEKYVADIHMINLLDTQDDVWLGKALADFDKSKIKYKRH